MPKLQHASESVGERVELDPVVEQLAREAHLSVEALRPEEQQYLKEHALKKPMGVLHIWALGVGAVITGEYFGWNGGLGIAGPTGMLLASLFVCALYMAWVLSLSELSVAMPFAGGPLAYGRRAVGPWFGFTMGWSMFLESLFAAIGTAIATGGYIYFVISLLSDALPQPLTTTVAALVTTAVFALVQWVGAKEQARIMEWMTYGAIFALVWFWIACIPNERAVTVAVLTCNLTALVWYVLAMVCLFVLRVKEPDMPRPYKVPLYPFLPALVMMMSVFAAVVYGWLSEPIVLWLTLLMYTAGFVYYFGFARTQLESAAPEELAARGVSPIILTDD